MNPLILLLLAPPAQAQDAFDAHGFNLAALDGDVRDPLEVLRAGRFQQWDWFAGGAFEFAKAPLVLVTVPSSGESTREVLLDIGCGQHPRCCGLRSGTLEKREREQ